MVRLRKGLPSNGRVYALSLEGPHVSQVTGLFSCFSVLSHHRKTTLLLALCQMERLYAAVPVL